MQCRWSLTRNDIGSTRQSAFFAGYLYMKKDKTIRTSTAPVVTSHILEFILRRGSNIVSMFPLSFAFGAIMPPRRAKVWAWFVKRRPKGSVLQSWSPATSQTRRWKLVTGDYTDTPRKLCTEPEPRGTGQGARTPYQTTPCIPWPARAKHQQPLNGTGWARKGVCGPKAPAGGHLAQVPTAVTQVQSVRCICDCKKFTARTRSCTCEPCSLRGRSTPLAGTWTSTRFQNASGEIFRRTTPCR